MTHHHDRAATAKDSTSQADATVYLARSPDFGRTWQPNQATWGGACPCCRITLARAGDGGVVAAWRHHFPGNVRDVVTATVAPEPGAPSRVHSDGWVYPGCPHNGPSVSVSADGRRHVVWYTGASKTAGLYYRMVDGAGRSAVAPLALVEGSKLPAVHGSVAVLAGNAVVAAFDASADGTRAISVTGAREGARRSSAVVVPGSEGGSYPQIIRVSDSVAVVAYTLGGDARRELRLARIAVPGAKE